MHQQQQQLDLEVGKLYMYDLLWSLYVFAHQPISKNSKFIDCLTRGDMFIVLEHDYLYENDAYEIKILTPRGVVGWIRETSSFLIKYFKRIEKTEVVCSKCEKQTKAKETLLYFCEVCNIWIEEKCDDPKCKFYTTKDAFP